MGSREEMSLGGSWIREAVEELDTIDDGMNTVFDEQHYTAKHADIAVQITALASEWSLFGLLHSMNINAF